MTADGLLGTVDGYAVRLVQFGHRYGVDDSLTNNIGEPLIEFYDKNAMPFHQRGEFVSRYLLSTLMGHPKEMGLQLEGRVPRRTISSEGLQQVLQWACAEVPMVRSHLGIWRVSYAAW